jgi:hypothetical protein
MDVRKEETLIIAGTLIYREKRNQWSTIPFEEACFEFHIKDNDTVDLYAIPQYGGEPCLIGNYKTIVDAMEKANTLA